MMLRKKAAEIVKIAEVQAEEKFNSSLKKIDSRKEDILEGCSKRKRINIRENKSKCRT